MLIGDKKKYLSILLTLKCELCKDTAAPTDKLTESAAEWFRSKRSSSSSTDISTVTDVIQACTGTDIDTSLVAAIQAGIDKANERAPSRAQRIQKWTILPRDFSLPGGELGPTMKLKRHSVVKLYEQTINSMYE
jgi:long-chain-fatty-acid--CoA ligase ACSBG